MKPKEIATAAQMREKCLAIVHSYVDGDSKCDGTLAHLIADMEKLSVTPESDLLQCVREQQAAFEAESVLLRAWARESRDYGWSTHQVDPMRRRADAIDAILARWSLLEGVK